MTGVFANALSELGTVLDAVSDADVAAAVTEIAGARQIVLYGCGREGLMLRALAMRLHHLGLRVAMQGDMTMPPLGAGDLFVCAAGPGDLPTVNALMKVARGAGARVMLITAEPTGAAVRLADRVLPIPAQTMARDRGAAGSILPMGSLFEGAMFLVGEALVLALCDTLGETAETMRARHTNME